MRKEIERKYLVVSDEYKQGARPVYIHQGFLSTEKERVVRVRIIDSKAFLTVKGITKGISRVEFEYEIPLEDARTLLKLCVQPTIEKTRYILSFEEKTWEVDEFYGENEGLVIAEIELESEDEEFIKPPWIGEEVSNDSRYYNSNLIRHPFKGW